MTVSDINVSRYRDIDSPSLVQLLARFGIVLDHSPAGAPIPGSFWGDEEAGLLGNRLMAREDTPLHSILHEACHYICMEQDRRSGLDTDAGGDYDEENAVCYLQILLADHVTGFSRDKMMADMDAWGYTFRLGSARAWFGRDAEDARSWLLDHSLIDGEGLPTFHVRTDSRSNPGSNRSRGPESAGQ
jgi:hypothetical protein